MLTKELFRETRWLAILVILSIPANNHALKFQIFRDLNLKGLIYDFEGKGEVKCTDVPQYATGMAGSVRTDQCLMAYAEAGCKGNSVRLNPTELESLAKVNKLVFSFHMCNDQYGGKKIRTDMFASNNDLIGEYLDVCGCLQLPTQISSKLTTLNNYGNCVKVYSTLDCSGSKFKEIPPGKSTDSDSLDKLEFIVRSISSCGTISSCVKLTSKVYKFDLDFPEPDKNTAKDVELAAKTSFYNNGSATVMQEYHKEKKITETFTVSRSNTIRQMESSTVEAGFETTVSSSFSFFGSSASVSATASLKSSYTIETSSESTREESYTHQEEKTFAITQQIQIPPCVEYVVNSMVSIIEKVPIPYWVYTKITGESGGIKMTAQEIRKHVEEMVFVEEYDNYTATFKSQHMLLASVGVDTWITGEGTNIENCQGGGGEPGETNWERHVHQMSNRVPRLERHA